MQDDAKARGVKGLSVLCNNVIASQEEKYESRCVFDSFDAARALFTAEYLFVRAQVLKKRFKAHVWI